MKYRKNNKSLHVLAFLTLPLSVVHSASLASFDLIGAISGGTASPISGLNYGSDESGTPDTVKNNSSSTNGARNDDNGVVFSHELDLIDYNGGAPQAGSDGINDIRIVITTSGLSGTHDFRSAFFTTSSTIGSRLGNHVDSLATTPTPTSGAVGDAGTTYSGLDVISQVIEIQFLSQVQAEVSDMGTFNLTSANTRFTNTNAYENTTIQLLGAGFNPYNAATASNTEDYVEDRNSVGYAAAGLFYANGDTQDGVGTVEANSQDNSVAGYPLHDDNVTLSGADADNASIAGGTLTGLRFTHKMVDTRGATDVNFDYTMSIASGSMNDLIVTPEPSSTALVGIGFVFSLMRRERRA